MLKCNWPKWILPWGILPVLLGGAALWANSGSLETKLSSAAEAQLKSSGADWAQVKLAGRDAMLSGEAPDEDAISKAAQMVAGTYGVRRVDTSGVKVAPPVVLNAPSADQLSGIGSLGEITGKWPEGLATTLAVGVAGATYQLGQNPELTSDGSGNWKLALPAPLAAGSYPVDIKITDGKKAEASGTGVITVQPAPEPAAPDAPSVVSASGDNPPVIKGTWPEKDGNELAVAFAGKSYKLGTDKELTSDGAGNWTLTPVEKLADGTFDAVATVTSPAGKTSGATGASIASIDATPPAAPTVNQSSGRSVRPSITGTWPEGDATKLTVQLADKTYELGKDGALSSDGSGNWSLKLDSDLADNTYDVVATATDAAGNSSTDRGFGEVVVDASAPAVPTVNTLLTRQRQPVITGAWPSKEAQKLSVAVGAKTYVAGAGEGLAVDGDNWTLRIGENLADGTYNVAATATDSFGNTAVDASDGELVVDATPPAVPTVKAYKGENTQPPLTGTFPESDVETLAITFDGETFAKGSSDALKTDGNGGWTLTTGKSYAPGKYDMKVVVADKAGNQRSDTTVNEIEIVEPPKPVVAAPAPAPAPAPTPAPAPAPVPAGPDCQALFNDALSGENFRFATAKARILNESNALLDKMADIIKQCPDSRVEIGGHTDWQGSSSYNQALSQRRANAVRDALIARGAKAEHLTAVGYGEDQPIADNKTKEGRAANRRTEFKVQN